MSTTVGFVRSKTLLLGTSVALLALAACGTSNVLSTGSDYDLASEAERNIQPADDEASVREYLDGPPYWLQKEGRPLPSEEVQSRFHRRPGNHQAVVGVMDVIRNTWSVTPGVSDFVGFPFLDNGKWRNTKTDAILALNARWQEESDFQNLDPPVNRGRAEYLYDVQSISVVSLTREQATDTAYIQEHLSEHRRWRRLESSGYLGTFMEESDIISFYLVTVDATVKSLRRDKVESGQGFFMCTLNSDGEYLVRAYIKG